MTDWNAKSGVTECDTCDGCGFIETWIGTYGTGNCEPGDGRRCEDCNGTGIQTCEVCGYDQVVSGIDCLVCDTVAMMASDELAGFDIDKFVHLFERAVGLAKGC